MKKEIKMEGGEEVVVEEEREMGLGLRGEKERGEWEKWLCGRGCGLTNG